MELFIGLIAAVVVCFAVLYLLSKRDNGEKQTLNKSSGFLCCASNKNSYAKARDVYGTLQSAGVEPKFLGEHYE